MHIANPCMIRGIPTCEFCKPRTGIFCEWMKIKVVYKIVDDLARIYVLAFVSSPFAQIRLFGKRTSETYSNINDETEKKAERCIM